MYRVCRERGENEGREGENENSGRVPRARCWLCAIRYGCTADAEENASWKLYNLLLLLVCGERIGETSGSLSLSLSLSFARFRGATFSGALVATGHPVTRAPSQAPSSTGRKRQIGSPSGDQRYAFSTRRPAHCDVRSSRLDDPRGRRETRNDNEALPRGGRLPHVPAEAVRSVGLARLRPSYVLSLRSGLVPSLPPTCPSRSSSRSPCRFLFLFFLPPPPFSRPGKKELFPEIPPDSFLSKSRGIASTVSQKFRERKRSLAKSRSNALLSHRKLHFNKTRFCTIARVLKFQNKINPLKNLSCLLSVFLIII